MSRIRDGLLAAAAVCCATAWGCGGEEPAADAAADDAPAGMPMQAPSDWAPSDDPRQARFTVNHRGRQVTFVAPRPPTWVERPPDSPMRLANWTVPGRDGHEAAHIVAFHFGDGGSVESNIGRWEQQFKPGPDGTAQSAEVTRTEVGDMPCTLVELEGAWSKMGQSWYTPDQLFLAAIVETDVGKVFLRFAGETATVEAAREDFLAMVEGLRVADGSAG